VRLRLILLGALCLGSAVMIVALTAGLTFYNDEWYVLLLRPGFSADSILAPHNGHLSALPVLVYKGFAELFGLDSRLPFSLLLAASVAALGVLVFLYVRKRVGELLALMAVALLVFMGAAWQDLLWPFQIGLIGSLVAGVGVLLALEWDDRRANLLACALLIASISLSNLGVSFVLAAALAVLQRRRPAELWVAAIPALLFTVWWVVYGTDSPSDFSLSNAYQAPAYVLDVISAGLASLVGLSLDVGGSPGGPLWGRYLMVLLVVGVVVWLRRGGRVSDSLLVVALAAFSFWILIALNHTFFRDPSESRYQLISGTFLVLMLAELFRGVELGPRALWVAGGLVAISVGAGAGAMKTGHDHLSYESTVTEAGLGALDIGRGHLPADYRLLQQVSRDLFLTGIIAGPYYRERDAHDSPAASPGEIATAAPAVRQSVDNVLAAGYGMSLDQARRLSPDEGGGRCARLGVGPARRETTLGPGKAVVTNLGQAPTEIAVRRFAPAELAIELGTLAGGFSARLEVPDDAAPHAWRLVGSGSAPLELCPA
jgi:hypothetical protein